MYFLIYRNNHKCNIRTIINHKYKPCHTKMKLIHFFSKIQKASQRKYLFLIKIIYSILLIIKKNKKF